MSALAVSCEGEEACLWSEIHCPSADEQVCAISCRAGDTDVCKQMIIDVVASYTIDYLSLDCAANGECAQIKTHCNDFGSSTDDSKDDSLLFFNATENEWQCHNFTQLDCCPWKSVAVADNDNDLSEVVGAVSDFLSTVTAGVTVVAVLIALGVACCVCNCIWGPNRRRLYDPGLIYIYSYVRAHCHNFYNYVCVQKRCNLQVVMAFKWLVLCSRHSLFPCNKCRFYSFLFNNNSQLQCEQDIRLCPLDLLTLALYSLPLLPPMMMVTTSIHHQNTTKSDREPKAQTVVLMSPICDECVFVKMFAELN